MDLSLKLMIWCFSALLITIAVVYIINLNNEEITRAEELGFLEGNLENLFDNENIEEINGSYVFSPNILDSPLVNVSYDNYSFVMTPTRLINIPPSDTPLEFNGSTYMYNNVFGNGIHLHYIILESGLKEELIVESLNHVAQDARFTVEVEASSPEGTMRLMKDEHNLDFEDTLHNHTRFRLPRPFIESQNDLLWLGFENRTEDGKLLIDITIDNDWLNNAEYPIKLDPSITLPTGQDYEDIHMAPINDTNFVVAWCDEIANDVEWAHYTTNGTLVGTKTLDTDVGDCGVRGNEVAITVLNQTTSTVMWNDHTGGPATYLQSISSAGTLTPATPKKLDALASYGVSLATINQTSVLYARTDDGTGRGGVGSNIPLYAGVDYKGENWLTETTLGTNSTGGSGIAITVGNDSDAWAVWHDGVQDDISYRVVNYIGKNYVTGVFDLDGTAPNSHGVDIRALNDTLVAVAWYDDGDQDITYTVARHWVGFALILFVAKDVDTNVGANSYSVGIAPVNSTTFGITYRDNEGFSPDNIIAGTFTYAGDVAVPIFNVTGTSQTAPIPVSAIGLDAHTGYSICDENFVLGYPLTSSTASLKTYHANGSTWDSGVCYSEVTDTCTYTSGDWVVDCADNCIITSNVNLDGNDVIVDGSGTFTVEADIKSIGTFINHDSCEVIEQDSGDIDII